MHKYFGDKKFYKMVLVVAVPAIIQNFITNFVSLLDNIMVGRVGTEQMSGVAIVNQLNFVFYLGMFGAVSGANIFGAQFFGQKDFEGLRHVFRFKLITCILLAGISILIFIFGGDFLINRYLLSTESEGDVALTFASGQDYLRVMLIGMVPYAISQVYASSLREMTETRVPMVASVIAVFTNLVFNYILIFGKLGAPEMGVVGAAWATVISRYVEFVIIASWTHIRYTKYRFIEGAYRSLRVPGKLVKQIIIRGMPLLINETIWAASIALLSQCYSLRGLEVVAAQNISSTITNLFNTVYFQLGASIAIIVGPLLGANKMEEARDTARKMIVFSIMGCVLVGLIIIPTAGVFPLLYNTSDHVRSLATDIMIITACFTPLFGFENAAYFTLRAGGKTGITFLFDSGYQWIIMIPLAFALTHFTNLTILPIVALVQASEIIKAVFGYILVKKGVWVNNLVNGMEETNHS
ncbi:MAG: MATE family efflux transporter [Lachnospiraceae bacterium]|nr:MATE family efflux transporter [Lachnospiraceae bacterium]